MNKTQFKKWVNGNSRGNFYLLNNYLSNGDTAIRRDSKHLPDIDPVSLLGPKMTVKEHEEDLELELNRLFSLDYPEPLYATELQYGNGILFLGQDKATWIHPFFVDCFKLNMVYGTKTPDVDPVMVDGVLIMPIKTVLPFEIRQGLKIILDME